MESKTIKGQAMIIGDSLVQDQILILQNGVVSENSIVLIKNIWDDLTSESGTFKSNQKKTFFYWEYKMTDPNNDDNEITVMIECPRPKDGMYEAPFDKEGKSDWEKFWLAKFKEVAERYEDVYAIQKKQVIFPETKFINSKGEVVEEKELRVDRGDEYADISNLLSKF